MTSYSLLWENPELRFSEQGWVAFYVARCSAALRHAGIQQCVHTHFRLGNPVHIFNKQDRFLTLCWVCLSLTQMAGSWACPGTRQAPNRSRNWGLTRDCVWHNSGSVGSAWDVRNCCKARRAQWKVNTHKPVFGKLLGISRWQQQSIKLSPGSF